MKQADHRFNQRLRVRLLSNAAAIEAIETQFGLDRKIVERFGFGLSERYPKSATTAREAIHQDALVAPLIAADGGFCGRYVYRHLASVTVDNRVDPPTAWCAGWSETYYSRKLTPGDSVIVCEDIADVWALAALTHGSAIDHSHVFIAPTRRSEWPEAWKSKDFWTHWRRVNIAIGCTGSNANSSSPPDQDRIAHDLARRVERDVYRLVPHDAVDWLTSRTNGIRYDTFHRLLKGATLLRPEDLRRAEARRYASAEDEDLSCSYSRGYLFEALRVLEREESKGTPLERLRTVVVRSDRTLHTVEEMPSPPGTPKCERVYRLVPDGTHLRRVPIPSTDSTWRWSSAHSYLFEKGTSPPLAALPEQIGSHLRASVWLPFKSDYPLLACVIAAT